MIYVYKSFPAFPFFMGHHIWFATVCMLVALADATLSLGLRVGD